MPCPSSGCFVMTKRSLKLANSRSLSRLSFVSSLLKGPQMPCQFPQASIGSDHDLLMMTFHLRLKRISKPKHTRLKSELEKLKDPCVLETFQAMIGRKFASLTVMNNEDTDMDSMIATFNTAVTETANEILDKHRQKKKKLGHCRNS